MKKIKKVKNTEVVHINLRNMELLTSYEKKDRDIIFRFGKRYYEKEERCDVEVVFVEIEFSLDTIYKNKNCSHSFDSIIREIITEIIKGDIEYWSGAIVGLSKTLPVEIHGGEDLGQADIARVDNPRKPNKLKAKIKNLLNIFTK